MLCFKCNNTIRSEFNNKIEIEKCAIFLISVSRILNHEKSYCFVRRHSITNMMLEYMPGYSEHPHLSYLTLDFLCGECLK